MRIGLRVGLAALLGLVLLAGVADAQTPGTLWMRDWHTYGTNATITDGTYSDYVGVGSFKANFGPGQSPEASAPGPLYCLDVYHLFHWNDQYAVERHTIPPWEDPPPYNVAEASWLYHTYGKHASSGVEAAGFQLALWEVTHEADWRFTYTAANWFNTGTGYAGTFGVSVGETYRNKATTYLDALKLKSVVDIEAEVEDNGYYTYYYRPVGEGADAGQGQMGDIPEPGTLVLLGFGLTAVGVGIVNRRRRR